MIIRRRYGQGAFPGIDPQEAGVRVLEWETLPAKQRETLSAWAPDVSFSLQNGFLRLQRTLPAGTIVGLGDKYAPLDKRGREYTFYNTDNPFHHPGSDPLYKSFPFFILVHPQNPLGFFVDHTGYLKIRMDTEGDGVFEYILKGEGMVEYWISGASIAEIVASFTRLTGKNAAVPFWALGYQQSRWGAISDADLLGLAHRFREDGFPCDVLYLDIDHMDNYKVFSWNGKAFPHPKQTIAELHGLGFKVSAILDPGIKVEKGYPVFEEAKENYFLRNAKGEDFEGAVWPGRTRFPDFLDSAARAWWSEKVAQWAQTGIDGAWNDMNEIAVFFSDADIRELQELLHELNVDAGIDALKKMWTLGSLGQKDRGDELFHLDGTPHHQVKNLYGREMVRGTYEGFKKVAPEKRPFLISRSAYPGIQKFGGAWTGDNASWWEHLFEEVIRVSSLGLCGVFYAGCDVGGFGDNVSPELLVRFLQMGAFLPLFRNHAAFNTHSQDPWAFGPDVFAKLKRVVQMRYRYFPYLYSQYMMGIRNDCPLVRPLLFDFFQDPVCSGIEDQFLCGDAVMVAPVTRPSVRQRAVYFPQRALDLNDGTVYEQGWHGVGAPLEHIPHFLLEGHGLVKGPDRVSLQKVVQGPVELSLFGERGSTFVYFDDGVSEQYRQGAFSLFRISWDKGQLHVEEEAKAAMAEEFPWNIQWIQHSNKRQCKGVMQPDGIRWEEME